MTEPTGGGAVVVVGSTMFTRLANPVPGVGLWFSAGGSYYDWAEIVALAAARGVTVEVLSQGV